jgi:hypothetical protein
MVLKANFCKSPWLAPGWCESFFTVCCFKRISGYYQPAFFQIAPALDTWQLNNEGTTIRMIQLSIRRPVF